MINGTQRLLVMVNFTRGHKCPPYLTNQATLLLLMFYLCGCASLPNTNISKVGNREVSYSSKGEGSPVVVLEAGMGPSMTTWAPIFDSISKITKVYAYNRPGYGRSTIGEIPATAKALAEQLHQNLEATGHNAPYLLAGHSAGGLYINMFARMYPDEVAGVLLLDSSHPYQFEYFKKEQPLLYSAFVTTTAIGKTTYEASILKNVYAEFDQIAPFPDVPLVVLTAEKSSLVENQAMRKKWLEFQLDLASMSSQAHHRVIEGSGHFIHSDKPKVVIEEIIGLVKASKKIQ